MKEFCSSITEEILENVMTFAKKFVSITGLDLRIIKHFRRSIHFSKEEFERKSLQRAVSTLPWVAMPAPKHVNLSVSISYLTLKQ